MTVSRSGRKGAPGAVTRPTEVLNAIGNRVFDEGNAPSETDRVVNRSLGVTDPDGDTALDETFELSAMDADEESNIVACDDVWQDAGEYDLSIELAEVVTRRLRA